jgi:hypothetical protein
MCVIAAFDATRRGFCDVHVAFQGEKSATEKEFDDCALAVKQGMEAVQTCAAFESDCLELAKGWEAVEAEAARVEKRGEEAKELYMQLLPHNVADQQTIAELNAQLAAMEAEDAAGIAKYEALLQEQRELGAALIQAKEKAAALQLAEAQAAAETRRLEEELQRLEAQAAQQQAEDEAERAKRTAELFAEKEVHQQLLAKGVELDRELARKEKQLEEQTLALTALKERDASVVETLFAQANQVLNLLKIHDPSQLLTPELDPNQVVAVVQNAMKEYSAATDAMVVRNAGLETELLCLRSSAEDTQRDVDEKESMLAQLHIQLTTSTEQTAASKKEVEAALDSLMVVIQKAEMIPDTWVEHDFVPDATADVRDIKDLALEFQTQIQGIMDKVLVDGGIVVKVEHTEGSNGVIHLKAVVDASASTPVLPLASVVSSFMQRNAELTEEVAAELRNLQPAVTDATDAASMVVSGMEELKATEATIAEETAKLQALETERAAQEATLQALQEEVNELEAAKASEAKIVISELESTCNEEYIMQSKKHQAAIQQLQKQVDDARKRVAKQRAALASNGIDAFPKAAPAIPASKPKPAPAIKALDPATVRNIFDIAGFEDDGIVVAKAKPTTKPSAKARPAPRRGAGGRG